MPDDPMIGTVVASHRIEAVIGQGGFSTVYRAAHIRLPRTRALKLLTLQLAHDAGFRERFELEWRLAARLEHPHIVDVIDAGEEGGRLYIVMQFVDGRDLAALLQREGPLQPRRALSLLEPVADALDAAHAQDLVHRDVKPQNILVANDGRVYLTDFGIAKAASASRALTRTGMFVGTPDYAAPEQFDAKPLDARTDVYALGGVLYTALTGAVPYEKTSDLQVMAAHMHEPPPRPSTHRSGLPTALDDVIARAMAKEREDRFASCAELVHATRAAASLADGDATIAQPSQRDTAPAPAATTLRSENDDAPPGEPRRRVKYRWVAAGAVALATAGAAVAFVAFDRGGDTAIGVDTATIVGEWKNSALQSARLRVAGTAANPTTIRTYLRDRTSHGLVAFGDVTPRDGRFHHALRLKEPALFGREYRLQMFEGNAIKAAVDRDLTLAAPSSGIVDRALMSKTRNGAAVAAPEFGTQKLWCRMHFAVHPGSAVLKFKWFGPGIRLGKVLKPYVSGDNAYSYLASGGSAPIPRGTWRCVLNVGTAVVGTARATIK